MKRRVPLLLVASLATPLATGCNDQNFSEIKLDAIAVSLGDFDAMGETLVALNVPVTEYDGFIVQAIYEPEDERRTRGEMAATVEGLLSEVTDKGQLDINRYNAVFLNSGTRGLGAVRYNDALSADDEILADAEMVDHACGFVENGGTIVVSDWAYDLVEACWPDAIEFLNDDLVVDDAQRGVADSDVAAIVEDELARESLGDGIGLVYDFSAWTAIEDVGAETEVLLRGTVEVQAASDEAVATLADAPLMVRFVAGRGRVVYTTFHWAAQNPTVAQALMLATVEGLGAANEEDADAAAEETDG